jgi:glyoxylase-like metal-dependent hydrolase (beta-lactamase superfamily II)
MSTLLHRRTLSRRSFVSGFALSPLVVTLAHPISPLRMMTLSDAVFRYMVGNLEVLVFNTDHRQVSSVMGAVNASIEEREAVSMAFGPLVVDTAVTLVDSCAGVMLIDSGSSSFLTGKLERVGYAPEDVDVVVFTHLHADHAGGALSALGRSPLFPNARYIVSRAEHAFWMNDDIEGVSEYAQPFIPMFRAEAQMIFENAGSQMDFVEWTDEIFPGAQMIPAIGHTGGHSAVEVTSEGETLLHVGDLIVNPVLHLEHPEWHVLASAWPEEDLASRRTLMDRAADEHMIVQTVHFPFPGVGYVEHDGDAWT